MIRAWDTLLKDEFAKQLRGCKLRDALSKQSGGLFVAKAGSNL